MLGPEEVAREIDQKINDMVFAAMEGQWDLPYDVLVEDEDGARVEMTIGSPYPDVANDKPLERVVTHRTSRQPLTLPVEITLRTKVGVMIEQGTLQESLGV